MVDGGVEVFNRIKNCPRCGQRGLKEGIYIEFDISAKKCHMFVS